jgi:hypothetical protein
MDLVTLADVRILLGHLPKATRDSVAKAQAFNDSAAQKEVNDIRAQSTKSRSFIVEGMAQ